MSPRSPFAVGLFGLIAALALTAGAATTHYVDVNSTNPVSPFLDWSTAATNIQQAVNVAFFGDSVLVADGIYHASPGASSTVSVNHDNVQIHSVNGPGSTIIEGSSTGPLPFARGVELLSRCVLDGFTVRNGGLTNEPSGIRISYFGTVVTNCIISDNKGGGVYMPVRPLGQTPASFLNCVITNNAGPGVSAALSSACKLTDCVIANNLGCGAAFSSLYRCLVIGNYITNFYGAGLSECYAENSLIISNRAAGTAFGAAVGGMTAGSSQLVNCTIAHNSTANGGPCVAGQPSMTSCIVWENGANDYVDAFGRCNCFQKGYGGFTNDPMFIDPQNGDFRLQSNSPYINAGFNRAVSNSLDYVGNTRIAGGTVDVGAYEYQTPTSLLSYIWAQTYGLPTDGTADFVDSDGDGMNNFLEFRAGTSPTNALSFLAMQAPTSTNWQQAVKLTWQSTSGTFYSIERSGSAASGSFGILRSNISGLPGFTTYTDTNVSSGGPYFYRVGVQ